MRPYQDLVDRIGAQEGVPSQAAQALVDTENGARDPNLVLAESWGGGSMGLTMITLRTARSLGFRGTPAELLVPEANLTFGMRYFRQMYDQVGRSDWTRAYAGYNAGPDLTPWPTAHVANYAKNLARWLGTKGGAVPPVGPTRPPSRAGAGGLTLLLVLGALLPMLVNLFRRKNQ